MTHDVQPQRDIDRERERERERDGEIERGGDEGEGEQGLLLLVLRHYITRQYIKGEFLHRSRYTQTHFHTDTFTRKHFNTQTLLYTDMFTHIRFYMQMLFTQAHTHFHTQTLSHTDAFANRCFSTQKLLHTDAFTHRPFYTQTLLHTNTFTHILRFYTRTLLHANTFTYRRFYTQTLLHSDIFTHRHFYTQGLVHADTFTHKCFYTQTLPQGLLHTDALTDAHKARHHWVTSVAKSVGDSNCARQAKQKHNRLHPHSSGSAPPKKHLPSLAKAEKHDLPSSQYPLHHLVHEDPPTRTQQSNEKNRTDIFNKSAICKNDKKIRQSKTHPQQQITKKNIRIIKAPPPTQNSKYCFCSINRQQTLTKRGTTRCTNIVAMEMLKNRKSAQDQCTIQCKASAL